MDLKNTSILVAFAIPKRRDIGLGLSRIFGIGPFREILRNRGHNLEKTLPSLQSSNFSRFWADLVHFYSNPRNFSRPLIATGGPPKIAILTIDF